MEEYKGIYYGDTTEQQFYEGGAHFKYIDLYKKLEILYQKQMTINSIEEIKNVTFNFFNLNNLFYSLIELEIIKIFYHKVKLEILLYLIILVYQKIVKLKCY